MTLLLIVVAPAVALVLGGLALAQHLGYLPTLDSGGSGFRGYAGSAPSRGSERRWFGEGRMSAPPGLVLALTVFMVLWILAWLVFLILGLQILTA